MSPDVVWRRTFAVGVGSRLYRLLMVAVGAPRSFGEGVDVGELENWRIKKVEVETLNSPHVIEIRLSRLD